MCALECMVGTHNQCLNVVLCVLVSPPSVILIYRSTSNLGALRACTSAQLHSLVHSLVHSIES